MQTLQQKRVLAEQVATAEPQRDRVGLADFINPALTPAEWIHEVGALLLLNKGVLLAIFNTRAPSPHDARHSLGVGQCIESWNSLCPETCLAAEAIRRGIMSTGCDLYVRVFPCAPCARFWAHTGIRRLYYAEGCLHRPQVEALKDGGVEIFQVK